jgi:hypothetical protein
MPEPLVLYSANTWLAYKIAERFYGNLHYVWCAPFFDPESFPHYQNTTPPSSSPSKICHDLFEVASSGDRHSAKVEENKHGILKGAKEKKKAGIINIIEWKWR